MTRLRFLGALLVGVAVLSSSVRAASGPGASAVAQVSSPPAAVAKARQLNLAVKPWNGDFDAMLGRRSIRFLMPFSRTLYFNDKGRERGLTAELARDFEAYVNKRYAGQLGKRPVTVFLIPTTRDKLLTNLQRFCRGRGICANDSDMMRIAYIASQ